MGRGNKMRLDNKWVIENGWLKNTENGDGGMIRELQVKGSKYYDIEDMGYTWKCPQKIIKKVNKILGMKYLYA